MRIAITGGRGFVGRNLASKLLADGHEVVVIGRPRAGSTAAEATPDGATVVDAEIDDAGSLEVAFQGCEAVAHCAGINREIGTQTYARVHVAGTGAVIGAAEAAGVQRLAMLSFLRARPDAPSPYHRSKWAAEEAIRRSSLTWTILKAAMIYGRGDHILDHLSRAMHTIPLFALVGLRDRPARPVAVADAVRVLEAAVLGDVRLANRTLAVLGPEQLSLGDVVRRVSAVTGRRVAIFRLPVVVHLVLGWIAERLMTVPLVALAQVRILAEGVVEPAPAAEALPDDLRPTTRLTEAVIRAGLPPPGGFGFEDLRWFAGRPGRRPNPDPPRPT